MTLDVEALAREAGFAATEYTDVEPGQLARFAALVRAAALEEAANECRREAMDAAGAYWRDESNYADAYNCALADAARAIRALKPTSA